MTTDRLIDFIREHGNEVLGECDGMLTVRSVVLRDGVATLEQETIPATVRAVRDWLAY